MKPLYILAYFKYTFQKNMRRLNAVNRKQALKVVKELDAFPKVLDDYKETTAAGGGGYCHIWFLCINEILNNQLI